MITLALGLGAILAWPVRANNVPEQFTPKDMLAAPRPTSAVAAPDGKHAMSIVSQWDPSTDATTKTVYVLDTAGDEPRAMISAPSSEIAEALWLSDCIVAYVNGTSLWTFGIEDGNPSHMFDFPEGTEPSALQYEPSCGTLAFSAAVWLPDLELSETAAHDTEWENRGYTGTVYNDLFVRHWDTWRIPGRVYTLGSVKITSEGDKFTAGTEFRNLLKGSGLYSQMDAIDGTAYSLSPSHVVVSMKPMDLNVATHTRTNVYLLPLEGDVSNPVELSTGTQGAISGVTFSPNYKKVAWLEMAEDGYESDKRVVVVHTLKDGGKGESERWTDNWDLSPQAVAFATDSTALFLIVEHNGRILPYWLAKAGDTAHPLYFKGSTQSMSVLDDTRILLSINSLTSPIDIYVLDIKDLDVANLSADNYPENAIRQISHFSKDYINGRLDGMVGEQMWFKGDEGRDVMAWTIKPRGWSEGDKCKWPLAFIIHGGPQSAFTDSWSTRWNLAVYASMGYFVVAPNPTGSTGFGQEFIDRITLHWGDRPYKDLIAGYNAALDKFPEIDKERTGALGASYGGYMVNWINGHNVFGFKCLVFHDGILDLPDMYYSTEEVWFPHHDFGGGIIDSREQYDRWNPLNYVQNWTTPQLCIQGGKDFRLPESQAIGTFTALQLNRVPSRFLYFPDENHWVLKPRNSLKWHHEVLGWLQEWIGAGTEPAPTEHNVTEPLP